MVHACTSEQGMSTILLPSLIAFQVKIQGDSTNTLKNASHECEVQRNARETRLVSFYNSNLLDFKASIYGFRS